MSRRLSTEQINSMMDELIEKVISVYVLPPKQSVDKLAAEGELERLSDLLKNNLEPGFKKLLSERMKKAPLLAAIKNLDERKNFNVVFSHYCSNVSELLTPKTLNYDIISSKERLSSRETLLLKGRVLDKKIAGALKLCDRALAHLGADQGTKKGERQAIFEDMREGLKAKIGGKTAADRVKEKEQKITNLETQLMDNFDSLNGHRISATPFFKGLIEFGIKVPAKAIGNMLAAASNTVLGTNFNSKSPLVTPFWRTKSVETVKDIKDVIYDRKSSFQK